MYGYPNNKPSGFTDDEARQATANAIRFWLSEQGEAESYSFTNRSANPNSIRAKSGYEHVLEYADELLAKARARQELPHAIAFTPSTVELTANGSGFSGQTAVKLTNINSGYTLNTSGLPAGAKRNGLYRQQKRNADHHRTNLGGRTEFFHFRTGQRYPKRGQHHGVCSVKRRAAKDIPLRYQRAGRSNGTIFCCRSRVWQNQDCEKRRE